MKRSTYKIRMKDSTSQEVEGYIFNNYWGIDKRAPGYYVLTEIRTGALVDSDRRQGTLKMLVQEPEFFDFDPSDKESYKKLSRAIKRYRDKNGWT